jgi:hypothetical protein
MKLDEKNTNKIINILDNLLYWETCPEEYKEEIPKLMKALNMHIVSRSKPIKEELTIESLKECEMEENENKELLKALDYYTDFTQSIEDKTLS